MKNPLLAASCLALLFLEDCPNNSQKASPAPPAQVQIQQSQVGRFVLGHASMNVGFDTKTGQICRTWDWSTPGATCANNDCTQIKNGNFGEMAPTCLELYHKDQ